MVEWNVSTKDNEKAKSHREGKEKNDWSFIQVDIKQKRLKNKNKFISEGQHRVVVGKESKND